MTNTPAMNRYSWYGKLPSAGDFLQRRFPDTLQRQWSHWFQVGLLAWQQEEQRSGERPFQKAPVWNFVVPPMLGSQMIQMGCLLPERDSVGRQYPVCIQLSFAPSEWSTSLLSQAESWYQQIGRLGLHAVRNSFSASQLDEMLMSIPAPQPVEPQKRSDILDVIGYDEDGQSTLGWPQAAECFDPLRQTSYWWTNRCDGYPLYTHVHSGNFTGQLFTLLFDPAGGARPGRHGLYPPMFE
ncbi:type VI secretion system-associated protein TagF [Enterobacter roggenkampii]|uniref:type VI secretion system-associated protein TagF n=1 Tax=Enterobacter roggenkampii TaxID=1812935 RepID=UPI001D06B65E|nr:type VI secretion system-associated protein TagF [Enterobacter roggenkampii]MCB7502948.1 type VI secretion system-associated protein TagF [Enterobacter roggenkampii]